MYRFWIFPLILGIVGAFSPLFSLAQAYTAWLLSANQPPSNVLTLWVGAGTNAVDYSSGWTFLIWYAIGWVAALVEMKRFGTGDRNGARATLRLVGNLWWIGIYVLLVYVSFTFAAYGLWKANFSAPTAFGWFPFNLVRFGYLMVNMLAIIWATIRTARSDDVLSPRVLRSKWRSSNRAIE